MELNERIIKFPGTNFISFNKSANLPLALIFAILTIVRI